MPPLIHPTPLLLLVVFDRIHSKDVMPCIYVWFFLGCLVGCFSWRMKTPLLLQQAVDCHNLQHKNSLAQLTCTVQPRKQRKEEGGN